MKELLRTITQAPGRFVALLAIVALGAGFYAGLRMTAPDMHAALDAYFDDGHVYDVRVVSTMGFEDADFKALKELPAVDEIMPARQTDVLATLHGESYVVRMHSIPPSITDNGEVSYANNYDYLNQLDLYEGRWPTSADECLLAGERALAKNIEVEDEVVVTQGTSNLDDVLSEKHLRVVGKVRTSYYVSTAAINISSLGSGVVQQVIYVPEDTFAKSMPYTEAYFTVKGAVQEPYKSGEYDALIDEAKAQVESIADERCRMRYDSLMQQMRDKATTYSGFLDLLEYRLSTPEEERDNPQMPEWLVLDRSKNTDTASYQADADRVDHIAQIFPTVFFLVAALVALTTMTRMVDEERQLIGTLKALGYARSRITGKYLFYAAMASGIGSVLGIAVLGIVLPYVIMNAYAVMYYAPHSLPPIDIPLALLSAGLAMGITLLATLFSVVATLRECPAALMLPRTPKAGKRILLEHVMPLWSRLSFTWKVTCRNLFRYKKRLFMTIAGIAGCTALLLTGLGLRDAINDIIDIQYGEIIHHNVVISLEDNPRSEQLAVLDSVLANNDLVQSSTAVCSETMLASGPRASDKRVDVVSPFNEETFAHMKVLRNRLTHELETLPRGKALVSEKLAQDLGVEVGDTLSVSQQDVMGNAKSEKFEIEVGGLFENYIYNYIYLDTSTYAAVFNTQPTKNALYANTTSDLAQRNRLGELLDQTGCVRTVSYNDEVIDTYRTMLRSVDLIVVVLVLSATSLAFIVLYNLTNINIAERVREIATLKVLGFLRRETNAYIFREIALISFFGALIGLMLGVWLESFVVLTAEVDQVMFGRTIHTFSFVFAFVLTMIFSGASMLLMMPALHSISMVESLKSNE